MVNISNRLLRFTQLGASTITNQTNISPSSVLIKLLIRITCGFIIASSSVYIQVIDADGCCIGSYKMISLMLWSVMFAEGYTDGFKSIF